MVIVLLVLNHLVEPLRPAGSRSARAARTAPTTCSRRVREAGGGGRVHGRDRHRCRDGRAQAPQGRPGDGGLRPGRYRRGGADRRAALARQPLLRADLALSPATWPLHGLNDLRGLSIQIGEEGSGIRPLALRLLRDSGVTPQNSQLLALTSEGAATALEAGRIDAAFFIMAPTVPLVRRLLLSPTVSLWSVRRTIAYTTRYRFLSTVTLGEGAVDLVTNVPSQDVLLLAATATLVVREDVHP
jgi:hypothetical protein